jgi:uncharacterized membrane protein YgdD (TMEM256/DUF423 family)
MTAKGWLVAAAVNGAIAVGVGAVSGHGQEAVIGAEGVALLRTGARYQMWHALALLAVSLLVRDGAARELALAAAGWAFLLGIVLFSGGLYLLVLTDREGLGAVVPVGGIAFVIGWIALAWHGIRRAGGS